MIEHTPHAIQLYIDQWAPLVGKRVLAGGLRVYFCLDSCLVLLTHKIMIMFCICVGVPLALCGRLVLVCYHPKKCKTKKSPGFYCNTYKHILHHKKHNNRLYLCWKKELNERCHGDGMKVAYVSNVTRPRRAILSARVLV